MQHNINAFMNKQISEAVRILNNGGIIIFPTDTAFGIGCRIDNKKAIEKLFKLRKRPQNQPAPVLVANLEMAKEYVKEITDEVITKLINPYWPGALTIVFDCIISKVPELVRGGGNTVGLRMPNNNLVLALINRAGGPILGPSANFHGEKTPFSIKDLNPELVKLADYVLDGECLFNNASTVIDVTQNPWKILRQGELEIKIKT
jgi:L-threonylcarbamoyladenylate synthase